MSTFHCWQTFRPLPLKSSILVLRNKFSISCLQYTLLSSTQTLTPTYVYRLPRVYNLLPKKIVTLFFSSSLCLWTPQRPYFLRCLSIALRTILLIFSLFVRVLLNATLLPVFYFIALPSITVELWIYPSAHFRKCSLPKKCRFLSIERSIVIVKQ